MRQRGMLAVITAVLLLAGCAPDPEPNSPAASPAAPAPKSVPTVLILDGSGSMTETDAPGPRIDAAKSAAHGLIAALPDDSTIALTTYGTATGSAPEDKAAGCRDVTTRIPLGPLDRTAINTAVDRITPSGYTPITLAIDVAANQLPADDTPQAIVLVSDGEETCDTPPCDTAARVKRTHPALTISTVGFKVDGPAADQLRCIADATGGIFVQAANADQLAARLLATQDIDQANRSLSSTGLGGIDLGTSIGDIRAEHPDFPDAATTGVVTVVSRDCDFTFTDGTLDSIAPHDGGRTIDGVTVGSKVSDATGFYGEPAQKDITGDEGTLIYTAEANSSNGYKITVEDYADAGGTASGTITSIVLCRCAPRAEPAVTEETVRNMTYPIGVCGNESRGWRNTAPITVVNGEGEARDASGEFAGASISDPALVGSFDADGDGSEDSVISFNCFGSTFDMCCAGRTSNMTFVGVFEVPNLMSPRLIGETVMPGESPIRGESYGEPRYIDQVRVEGSTIVTDEKLVYADTSALTEDLGFPPDATIEVTHRFTDGRWESTERVVG